MSDFVRSDHLSRSTFGGYRHHFIVSRTGKKAGDSPRAIHFTAPSGPFSKGNAQIIEEDVELVRMIAEGDVQRHNHSYVYTDAYVVVLARKIMAQQSPGQFHLMTWNCESFARMVTTGKPVSVQVEHFRQHVCPWCKPK